MLCIYYFLIKQKELLGQPDVIKLGVSFICVRRIFGPLFVLLGPYLVYLY